jgi:hypothetical protein
LIRVPSGTWSCCCPLPGRNAHEAREAFLVPLRRALSCITDAQLFVPGKSPGDLEALALSADPLRLRSGSRPDHTYVKLVIGHQFRVVQDGPTDWHVSTAQYEYYILDDDERELIAWHWHPGSRITYPHLHAPAGTITHKMHVPTGRVSIESVLRMLLNDLAVSPMPARTQDFSQILDESERNFIEHRRWHG